MKVGSAPGARQGRGEPGRCRAGVGSWLGWGRASQLCSRRWPLRLGVLRGVDATQGGPQAATSAGPLARAAGSLQTQAPLPPLVHLPHSELLKVLVKNRIFTLSKLLKSQIWGMRFFFHALRCPGSPRPCRAPGALPTFTSGSR